MSEQFSPPNPEERMPVPIFEPTPEQMSQGFELGSDQLVIFSGENDARNATRSFKGATGLEITGSLIGVLNVGGEETNRDILLINTGSIYENGQVVRPRITALIPHAEVGQLESFSVTPGSKWGIGRKHPGQDKMPDTVSGDHCFLGMSEEGKLLLRNNKPTNRTTLKG